MNKANRNISAIMDRWLIKKHILYINIILLYSIQIKIQCNICNLFIIHLLMKAGTFLSALSVYFHPQHLSTYQWKTGDR